MQKAKKSYGEIVKEWQRITRGFEDNQADLAHLEAQKARLQAVLNEALEISQEQAAFTASRQSASRRLETALREGQSLATFLRAGVKERYGNRSEKLVEFGVRPFRSRRQTPLTPQPPGPEAPAPDPSSQE